MDASLEQSEWTLFLMNFFLLCSSLLSLPLFFQSSHDLVPMMIFACTVCIIRFDCFKEKLCQALEFREEKKEMCWPCS